MQAAPHVSFLSLAGSSFSVAGASLDSDIALVGIGASIESSDHLSLGARLDGSLGALTKSATGSVNFAYTW